jgi:hypothetical protein
MLAQNFRRGFLRGEQIGLRETSRYLHSQYAFLIVQNFSAHNFLDSSLDQRHHNGSPGGQQHIAESVGNREAERRHRAL